MITPTILRRVLAKLESAATATREAQGAVAQKSGTGVAWDAATRAAQTAQTQVHAYRLLQNDSAALIALADALNAETR